MDPAVVIDASVAVRALLPGPSQSTCRAHLRRCAEHGTELVAPTLWTYETTSTLSKLHHFGELTDREAELALAQLGQLDVRLIAPDSDLSRRAFDWSIRLQRASAYDCFYLALAQKLGCELWTTDQKLRRALDESWVRELAPAD